VCLGIVATGVYLSSAAYYFIVNLTIAPADVDHHILFGFGIVIALLLGLIGEIPPYGGPLSGPVRVCAVCVLPNIAERRTCKRCRARLGSVERV
jgi:hypothetical protein